MKCLAEDLRFVSAQSFDSKRRLSMTAVGGFADCPIIVMSQRFDLLFEMAVSGFVVGLAWAVGSRVVCGNDSQWRPANQRRIDRVFTHGEDDAPRWQIHAE